MDINRLSLVKASALASTLLLTACGGGGGGDSETSPDPEPNPTPKSLNFTSESNVSVSENSNSVVYTAKADSTGTSFSIISGADKDLFNLDGTSGNLSFKTIPDFESPADSNQDNVYEITIRAQNGETSKDLALKLTVSNIPVEAIASQNVSVDENTLTITTLPPKAKTLVLGLAVVLMQACCKLIPLPESLALTMLRILKTQAIVMLTTAIWLRCQFLMVRTLLLVR